MRRAFLIALLLSASAAMAAKQLTSSGGEVQLFANQKRAVGEKSVYTGTSTETYAEVSRSGNMVKVRTKDGQELWAESKSLKEFSQTTGANMDLGSGKIEGYLDNPQAVYILQEESGGLGGIQLDRSFVDAIQGNMDREATESRNGENN